MPLTVGPFYGWLGILVDSCTQLSSTYIVYIKRCALKGKTLLFFFVNLYRKIKTKSDKKIPARVRRVKAKFIVESRLVFDVKPNKGFNAQRKS